MGDDTTPGFFRVEEGAEVLGDAATAGLGAAAAGFEEDAVASLDTVEGATAGFFAGIAGLIWY